MLLGQWEWDLAANAVYCSDVMSFPPRFEGTKGIFHPDDLNEVTKALEILQDGAVPRLQFRLITSFGEVKSLTGREVSIAAAPVKLENEAVAQNRESQLQEISLRKEAATMRLQQQLHDYSDKLYGTGTWYTNKTTGDTWYSDNIYRLHGVPPHTLNAHANTFHLFIHPEDRVAVSEAIENAYAAEVPLHIEYRIVQPSGAVRRVRQITHWFFDERGQLIFSGAMCDITDVHGLQQNLDATVTANRQLLQLGLFTERQASSGYWYMNMVTRKVTFSDNYLRIHGVKTPFVPSHQTFLKLVHPDDRERITNLLEQVHREHALPETEYRIIRPDGRERQLRLSGKLSVQPGTELMMMGAVHDITAQKALELNIQTLAEAQVLQKLTTDLAEQAAEVYAAVWFPSGQMQWSDGLFRLLGYKPTLVEPTMRLWQKSIYPEDTKAFNDTITRALNGQAVSELHLRVISKWGIRHLRLSFRQLAEVEKEGVLGVIQDVTAFVTLQEGAKSNERYASLLENRSSDIILLTNTENVILNWNKNAEEKTGIKKDNALFSNLFDVFPALHEEKYLGQLQTVLNGREIYIEKTRNGYLSKIHSYSMVPFRDEQDAVQGVLHLVRDISRELETERQLSERLLFIEKLLDASIDRIVVLDQHMNYLYWNPKAEAYYDMSKQEVLGKNILEIFPAFRNDPSYREFRRALKGETVHIPAMPDEGQHNYFETYLIPVKGEEGSISGVLWIVHDLSKEFELQHERRKHLGVLQKEHHHTGKAQGPNHSGSFDQ
jgi:PAS domain S-box-containing protein